jgi:ubiquinone biosynthesis protein
MFKLSLKILLLTISMIMIYFHIPYSERLFLFNIIKMGPFFIKMGQFLSTRQDIIGKKYAMILRTLCDEINDKSQNDILVPSFIKDPEFISSASIACVYKGFVNDDEVAVKIIKPGIVKIVSQNILHINVISRFFSRFTMFKKLNFDKIVKEFEGMMIQETNMLNEVNNMNHLRLLFFENKSIKIPKVYYNLSNMDVIVMEWIDGVTMDKIEGLKLSSIEKLTMAESLISLFMIQYYKFGFFHADPHNGNIILSKNYIGIIDFGMCAKINAKDKFYVTKIVHDFVSQKYREVAIFHKEIGYVPVDTNIDDFAIECKKIGDSIFDDQNQLSIGNLMFLLFEVSKKFGMEIQPHLLMLQRSIIMIEGIAKSIDSSINIWDVMKNWMSENLGLGYYVRLRLLYLKRCINKII